MGSFLIVKTLIESGANASVVNNHGETPLDIAAERGFTDICTYLSETGGVDISVLYTAKNHIIQPQNKDVTGAIDEYGWYIEHRVSQQLHCSDNPPEHIKPKYIKKCLKIIHKWDKKKNQKKRFKKYRKHIIKGHVSRDIRGEYWKIALGINELRYQLKIDYRELLQESIATKDVKQIDKDVARTMRTHKMFSVRYGEGQMKLFRILRAYAAYDPEIGYVQSMSSVVAMLLLFIDDEEECFYAMISLFAKHGLRYMLIRDLEGLRDTSFTIFQKLVGHYFPEVDGHLEMIGIHPSLFLPNWLLEMFFGYIPFNIVLQLWDLVMLDGYSVLYSFILAIIDMNEDELLNLRDAESFNDVKHSPVPTGNVADRILHVATKYYKLDFEKINLITGLYPHPI